MRYKVVLIDDEDDGILVLKTLLEKFHPNFVIVNTFNEIDTAKEFVCQNQIDLIFLDIEMPDSNGIDFSKELAFLGVKSLIIFVTAHLNYMKDAFKVTPFDYLTKPVVPVELSETLFRFKNNYHNRYSVDKISLTTHKGIEFFNVNELLYAKYENKKTMVFTTDNEVLMLNRSLKDVKAITSSFLQVNKSVLVNSDYIRLLNNTIITVKKGEINETFKVGFKYLANIKLALK